VPVVANRPNILRSVESGLGGSESITVDLDFIDDQRVRRVVWFSLNEIDAVQVSGLEGVDRSRYEFVQTHLQLNPLPGGQVGAEPAETSRGREIMIVVGELDERKVLRPDGLGRVTPEIEGITLEVGEPVADADVPHLCLPAAPGPGSPLEPQCVRRAVEDFGLDGEISFDQPDAAGEN